MQIDTRQIGDITVIDIVGRLDSSTVADAYDEMVAIATSGATKVLINLNRLEYISSAGLRNILIVAKLLKSSKGEIKICHATDIVKEVLDTSGVRHLIDIYEKEINAIAAFRD